MEERNERKTREGIVISTKMNKTAIVKVEQTLLHPTYGKVVKRSKKYYAHDEDSNSLQEGDRVTIVECRPISKLKRWRVVREKK